jgi:hypothetical protein
MRKLVLAFLLSVSAVAVHAASLTAEQLETMKPKEIEANLPDSHPMAYFAYGIKLFKSGKYDPAVQWYYIGLIRYRHYLLANPDLPADETAQLDNMKKGFGKAAIDYAGGVMHEWTQTIDKALAWDKANPNNFTSKETFATQWQQARDEVSKERDNIKRNEAQIKAERASRGLTDR